VVEDRLVLRPRRARHTGARSCRSAAAAAWYRCRFALRPPLPPASTAPPTASPPTVPPCLHAPSGESAS
jgi:hypothetical protein